MNYFKILDLSICIISSPPGTSYAYDDQETSSDSDDEVLRHYQQSIQRVPSQRSVHSSRSQKSSASKSSE